MYKSSIFLVNLQSFALITAIQMQVDSETQDKGILFQQKCKQFSLFS